MRLSLFLAVNFAFALDWRIKKAAFNDRNEKYEEIMAKIDSADTFDEIQVLLNYEPGIYQLLGPNWRGNGKKSRTNTDRAVRKSLLSGQV